MRTASAPSRKIGEGIAFVWLLMVEGEGLHGQQGKSGAI